MVLVAEAVEQINGFLRVQWHVLGDDSGAAEHLAQASDGARLG